MADNKWILFLSAQSEPKIDGRVLPSVNLAKELSFSEAKALEDSQTSSNPNLELRKAMRSILANLACDLTDDIANIILQEERVTEKQ